MTGRVDDRPDVHYSEARPIASVVVPCRNEERFIGPCLTSLLSGDYPPSRLEVIVVDGFSADRSRDIIRAVAASNPRVRLVDNPSGTIPSGLNIGIAEARGSVVLRCDAHATYSTNYISELVDGLAETGAPCVGGVRTVEPSGDSSVARAIAMVLNQPFGTGGGRHRRGGALNEPVDVVSYPAWPAAVLGRLGKFDEALLRSEDRDFNDRLRSREGEILLRPGARVTHFASSTFRDLARHSFTDGYWMSYPALCFGTGFPWYHYGPPLFVAAVPISVALARSGRTRALKILAAGYGLAAIATAASTYRGRRDLAVAALVPVGAAVLHCSYGGGALAGVIGGLRDLATRRVRHRHRGWTKRGSG
jgi:glycosyltransferase involved in cell wall biosynthesis